MTMQEKLNNLIDKGLITSPTPSTIPHNPDNFSYVPTITTYSTNTDDSNENNAKDA